MSQTRRKEEARPEEGGVKNFSITVWVGISGRYRAAREAIKIGISQEGIDLASLQRYNVLSYILSNILSKSKLVMVWILNMDVWELGTRVHALRC